MHDLNTHSCCNEGGPDCCVIQDGVSCPKISPWGRHVGFLTGIPLVVMSVLAVYILSKTSIVALIVWLMILFLFAVPLRYLVCARCPYYGQSCSTLIGPVIPRLMKKQEGRSMKAGLWLDVIFFVPLFLIPLFYSFRDMGWPMALLWTNVMFFVFLILTRFGCAKCPFTFCPIGKAGRALWIVK